MQLGMEILQFHGLLPILLLVPVAEIRNVKFVLPMAIQLDEHQLGILVILP